MRKITTRPGEGLIRLGDHLLPLHVYAEIDDEGLPYIVSLEISLVTGYPQCDSIRCVQKEGGPSITGSGLRQVAVGKLVRDALSRAAVTIDTESPGQIRGHLPQDQEDLDAFGDPIRKAPRRKRLNDDFFQAVATTYREAMALGLSPRLYVADMLGGARSTAGSWVMEARRRGFLGKAKARRPGEFEEDM